MFCSIIAGTCSGPGVQIINQNYKYLFKKLFYYQIVLLEKVMSYDLNFWLKLKYYLKVLEVKIKILLGFSMIKIDLFEYYYFNFKRR